MSHCGHVGDPVCSGLKRRNPDDGVDRSETTESLEGDPVAHDLPAHLPTPHQLG